MSIQQMMTALKNSYPGEKWHKKVDNMSNAQIYATYQRLLHAKKL